MAINIRKATETDNNELIHLASLAPMKGSICIRVERTPNFFSLCKERGETEVFVATIEPDNSIVGCFSYSKQLFYSYGEAVNMIYLADLKVHPRYLKSRVAYMLVKHVYLLLKSMGADLLICTAVNDNIAVMPFFTGAAGIPKFSKAANFNIYQILPKKGQSAIVSNIDHEKISSFYSNSFKKHSLCTAIETLQNCIHFTETENETLIAAISVFDPSHLKQTIAVKLPLFLRLILKILQLAKYFYPLPEIPLLNKPLKILFIKYFFCKDGHEKNFQELLKKVRTHAYQEKYNLINIAIDERDIHTNTILKKISFTKFSSLLLVNSLTGNQNQLNKFCRGICYEDFSIS